MICIEITYSSIKLVSFNGKDDEAFVGCIQGVFINTNPIKFTGKNINSGCQSSDICKTEANTYGAHGQCNNIYGEWNVIVRKVIVDLHALTYV